MSSGWGSGLSGRSEFALEATHFVAREADDNAAFLNQPAGTVSGSEA
jgi:hypothetical protein